jgi:hypothetical protein
MRLLKIIFLFTFYAASAVYAQDTNVITLYTKLEAFEAQTGKTIIKAWGQMGTISANATVISVSCREATDVVSGEKESGVVVGFKTGNSREYRMVVDYDELDSVLEAIDYISKVDLSVTSLPSFQAIYRTRSDLRFLAYNSTQRTGTVQALQIGYSDANRIPLGSDQLNQFKVLMRGAKEKLDALKKSGM